jgi:flavorubredoxin
MSTATIEAPTTTAPATAPYRIANDTYVLPHVFQLPGIGYGYMNSMVILGKEPIVVDTSGSLLRDQYFTQLESLVDPKDVRWIYLSHDDVDHTGNLMELLERAPNATFIGTWFMVERESFTVKLPLERMRWVNDGESFDAGDRTLHAVRPPIFDSPVTRGLFDPKTGVYWAADSFGAVSPEPVTDAGEIPADAFRDGSFAVHSLVSPWHQWLDSSRYAQHVNRIASLPIRAIASGHGPAIYGSTIGTALDLMRELPGRDKFPEPTQRDLEAMLAAQTTAA